MTDPELRMLADHDHDRSSRDDCARRLSGSFGDRLIHSFGDRLTGSFGDRLIHSFGDRLIHSFGDDLTGSLGDHLTEQPGHLYECLRIPGEFVCNDKLTRITEADRDAALTGPD